MLLQSYLQLKHNLMQKRFGVWVSFLEDNRDHPAENILKALKHIIYLAGQIILTAF